MIEPSKIGLGVCDIATSATKTSRNGRGHSSKETAKGSTAQNVANVASVASRIPKTTRASRHPRPQAGALLAVTDVEPAGRPVSRPKGFGRYAEGAGDGTRLMGPWPRQLSVNA
jgi:hypothetical protein